MSDYLQRVHNGRAHAKYSMLAVVLMNEQIIELINTQQINNI